MPKARNVQATRKRHKRTLNAAKGYFGNRSRLYRYAKQAVIRAGVYAYRDRRKRKSEMRSLWIVRINTACREEGITYSRFISGMLKANIQMDRKQISEMAINDPAAFKALVAQVKKAA